MPSITPTFSGEIMLAGWQESHTAGAKITFWLPDSASLEVFKGMTAKKGNTAGQRFMAVLVEIGDDDQPAQEVKPADCHAQEIKKDEINGGALARLAGMWCNNPDFYQWIRPIYDRELGGNGNTHGDIEIGVNVDDWKDFCRHAILVICDIKSRAELDNNPVAADKFHRYVRVPFSEWLKWRGAK